MFNNSTLAYYSLVNVGLLLKRESVALMSSVINPGERFFWSFVLTGQSKYSCPISKTASTQDSAKGLHKRYKNPGEHGALCKKNHNFNSSLLMTGGDEMYIYIFKILC